MRDRLARRWQLLAALGLLAAATADAAIYRCAGKGRTTVYRDQPCSPKEHQTVIGQGDLAGCFEIEDVTEWDGGSGRWTVRVAADGESYQLREYFSVDNPGERPPASVPLRRANLEEMDAVAQRYNLKVTGGFVLAARDSNVPMGLFNTWNHDGALQLVGLFSFANGVANRVTCP